MQKLTIQVPVDIECGTYTGAIKGSNFILNDRNIPLPERFPGEGVPATLEVKAGGIGYLTFL